MANDNPRVRGRRGRLGRAIWGVLGLLLLAAGLAAAAVSYRQADPKPSLLGGNLPVNPTALNRNDLTSNNTPTVVANPRNPANLASVNRIDAPDFSCALNVSMDGGASWAPTRFPAPPGDKASCLAPDVTWASDGTLYASFSNFASVPGSGLDPAGVYLVSSKDGGRTLSPPVMAQGPFAFEVRLLADPAVAGRLYLTWVQTTATTGAGFSLDNNPLLLARSDNGGATWGKPVTVSPTSRRRPLAPALAAAPNGDLFLSYLDVQGDSLDYLGVHQGKGGEPYAGTWSLVVARSKDGGVSWRESDVDTRIVPTQRFVDLFAPTPSIAVEGSTGRVFVAFHDARLGDADVYVWASTDRAVSWGSAHRVNDTGRGDRRSQYLPAIQVAPGGRLDVVYYDRRADSRDVLNEVSLQSSFDHAATFTPRLELSEGAFDSKIGFGNDRDLPELGSRLGLVSTDSRALAQWCDTRGGVRLTKKQDIGQAIADFADPFPARLPLRYGGPAVAALGLIALVWAVLPSRRRRSADNSRESDE
ncbi:MAG: sialidase family protein [Candidatus Dormibacteria bacterium]